MPRLLIKIRQGRWLTTPRPPFLSAGDIPANCLQDLHIKENALSVWHIQDDESNLTRVVTALAATLEHIPSSVDCLLFDEKVVESLGLKMKTTNGETPDRLANRSWHRDLVELSGRKILDLLLAVFYEAERRRVFGADVKKFLQLAVTNKEVEAAHLSPGVAAKLQTDPLPVIPRFFRMCREVSSSSKDAWHRFRHP